jgi:hypothetical protein
MFFFIFCFDTIWLQFTIDTSEKFSAGVNDAGGQFTTGIKDTGGARLELRIFSRISLKRNIIGGRAEGYS